MLLNLRIYGALPLLPHMLSWHGALWSTFSMCNLSLGFMLFMFLVEDISL